MGDGPTTGGEQATALATPANSADGPPTVAATAAPSTQTVSTPLGDLVAGRYRIEAVLGTGGMAAVYRARDEILGRHVALKIIAPAADDPANVRRERTEVELLASLNHHALVTLYDAGVQTFDGSDRTYLVMELVEGSTLADRLTDGPLAAPDATRMAVDLAEALHVVHDHGVVHRDIKPGNVLLRPSHLPGRELTAKLADFGIAYLVDSTRLTVAGGLIGTAAYLSPEQAQGHPPAPASDIYSLGLVLLETLTGVRAFPGTLMESISARLVNAPAIPADVDPAWADLLTRMTARTPEDRPTALEVALAARAIELDHDLASTPSSGTAATAAQRPDGGPVAPGAATTAVLPAVRAGSGDATPSSPSDPATLPPSGSGTQDVAARRASTAPRAWWRGRRGVVVVLALVALVVGALVVAQLTSPETTEPPVLPAVEEPLGTHLDELLQSVTP